MNFGNWCSIQRRIYSPKSRTAMARRFFEKRCCSPITTRTTSANSSSCGACSALGTSEVRPSVKFLAWSNRYSFGWTLIVPLPIVPQMPSEPDLLEPLRRYWGYDSFRPMQERIVRSLLAGRDTCVVMATGGGKSLCYQLPASLASEKTAIVISPLIALMQDQTAQLAQIGIEAAVLNSSLAPPETESIMRNAVDG